MAKSSDLRITLDGSRALVSNVSQHSGERGTFVTFRDVITDVANRIVKREGKGATLGSVAGTEIQILHEYVFVDPATGTSYTYVLGAIDSGSYVYATINSGATWSGQTLPITPTQGGRWFFCNDADNRSVLAVNGRDAMLIGSQAYASITLTSAGLTATATSSAPHPFTTGETVIIAGALPAAYNGSYVITKTGDTTFTYAFAGGTSPATGNISATVQRIIWRKAGQAAPSVAPTYSLATNDPPYNTGTISCTNGSNACVGIGTAWTTGAAWVGKHININGNDYTIATVTTGTALTLTEQFKETTGTYAYNIFYGIGDWVNAPRYCFAFRNPTTGHLSNVSPVLEITEKDQFGRTITVTIAGSAENTTAYNNGYTQIQLFRSARDGYVLVALNEYLANNAAGSAITYVETAAKFANTFLTDLLAPFDQNGVPPAGISAVAFHQDRMWALTIDGRLRFTPTQFELSYGVAIEAWPSVPQFSRRIRAKAAGILVVGATTSTEALIIQTAIGDYSVEGFDALTYRVFRLRTRKSGGHMYAAGDLDGDLVEFYRDKRLMTFPSGADIGIAIQDKLSAVRDSIISKVRLHWFASKNRNFLLLSVPSSGSSTANDLTYVFDLDKGGSAYEINAGFSAFATVHDATTGEVQLWGGDSTGAVYRLLGASNQDAGANFTPVIKTSIIRPLDSESWGRLAYVHLFVNDASGTWTGRIFIHEQTSSGATDGTTYPLTFRVAPAKSQSAQGKKLVATFAHSKRTRSEAFQLEVTFPTQNASLWIEKIVVAFKVGEERVA
jgi:hypothetical protein